MQLLGSGDWAQAEVGHEVLRIRDSARARRTDHSDRDNAARKRLGSLSPFLRFSFQTRLPPRVVLQQSYSSQETHNPDPASTRATTENRDMPLNATPRRVTVSPQHIPVELPQSSQRPQWLLTTHVLAQSARSVHRPANRVLGDAGWAHAKGAPVEAASAPAEQDARQPLALRVRGGDTCARGVAK